MPKLKTKKTLLKRIRITKKGKVMKMSTRMGHLKIKSDASRKGRKKGQNEVLGSAQTITLKRLLAKRGKGIGK